ncbi:MAG TPA: PDDEXK nuclease domain-containing protein [Tepidisphaeraceae bacterium]|jgi:predicted nuclease of restriction endonuclease-like (RecB) superfamily|nr:PDDEXK nuclease domain-containing protein [Tepidisphaeraceae bacterium]
MPKKLANLTIARPTSKVPADYPVLLATIRKRIAAAQARAALAINGELTRLYWEIGRDLVERQARAGWGARIIPRLANDIRNQLPEVSGFSERNIGRMIAFHRAYPGAFAILPPAVAKLASASKTRKSDQRHPATILPPPVAKLGTGELDRFFTLVPWAHHVLLMERVKDLRVRAWYMEQTIARGWSRDSLALQISGSAHLRQGNAITNFTDHLPPPQSDLARQMLKDPYIFDFLTLEEPFHEREREKSLLRHVEKFLLELGHGFAFVGRQYPLQVGGEDFRVDLLFYQLRLRCYIVIDLKKGAFKAEYAGKMNFYCNLVDERLRQGDDQATIGLILCQDRNRLVAEYALKGMNKAIGVSEYQLTRSLPKLLRSTLPSIEEIEAELATTQPAVRAQKAKGAK